MVIAVDVGNTNLVLGCIENGEIAYTARISTARHKTSDEYAIMFRELLALNEIPISSVEGGIISTVVPELSGTLRTAIRKMSGKDALVVGSGVKTGMNILMDFPSQVGSDLIVDAVAASAQYKKPIMVFDLGTATTVSVVDAKGNYIGGMIMAGIVLSLEALASRTAQLPHVNLQNPKGSIIGKNTIDCMKSGSIYGNAAMIDGVIDRVTDELGEPPTVVATGGLARIIAPYCRHREIICDDTLVLKGLWLLYNKNRPRAEKRKIEE